MMPEENLIDIRKGNPTPSDVHINRSLTNISIAFMQSADTFIASKLFPAVPVMKQSDLFFKYNKGDFLRIEGKRRAPGTESAGGGYDIGTDNFFCHEYSLHKDVTWNERDNSDEPLNADRDATEWVTENLLALRERDFLRTIFVEANWSTNAAPTTKWDVAGSTPIEDIKKWARATAKSIAKPRSQLKLVVTPDVDDVLSEHPDFVDRVKYTSRDSVSTALIANLCGIGEYLVTEAVEAPNAKGSADQDDVEYMVDENQAVLMWVAPRPSLKTPSAGYIFSWTAGDRSFAPRIDKFPMRKLRADRIEGMMNYDIKIVVPDAGMYLKELLTA
jgi:hypothetical protein